MVKLWLRRCVCNTPSIIFAKARIITLCTGFGVILQNLLE